MRRLDCPGPAGEGLELHVEEPVFGVVGGREMAHHPGQLDAGCREGPLDHPRGLLLVARPEPAHAAVELHVDAPAAGPRDLLELLLPPQDHVGPRGERPRCLGLREGTHDEQARSLQAADP